MNYIEALQELMNGKKIRHKNWDKDEYVHLVKGAICTDYKGIIELSICDLEDLTEDMWEIYQTEEDKLIQAGKRWEIVTACFRCKNCTECDREQKELHKVCHRQTYGTLRDKINKLSDSEVNKLYNTLKGEI